MSQFQSKFCFCSLAIGKKYRALAQLLAQDINKYSPNTAFIVLTDNPQDFSNYKNVITYKHRQQGIKCYHDKRFAISKALSQFNSCIYIDADMRILSPIPQDMEWIREPGIAARACDIMPKKYITISNSTADSKLKKEFQITQKAAKKLNIHDNWNHINFVYEYLFAVTKDNGKEEEFIKVWGKLAPLFEMNGVFDGEGNAVGLAAASSGLSIRWCEMKGISFFKDRTEMVRVKKGQSSMEDVSAYFEQQRMLEHPQSSLLEKSSTKLSKGLTALFNFIKMRLNTLNNFNFYYR